MLSKIGEYLQKHTGTKVLEIYFDNNLNEWTVDIWTIDDDEGIHAHSKTSLQEALEGVAEQIA